jgi:chitinase
LLAVRKEASLLKRPKALLVAVVAVAALIGGAHCGGSAGGSPSGAGSGTGGQPVQTADAGASFSPSDDAGGGSSLSNDAAARAEAGAAKDDAGAPDGAASGDDAGSADDGSAPVEDASSASDGSPAAETIVGGYYPNWTPSPVRIRDVDPHYNLIYLFAATPVGGAPGTGPITWTAPGDGLGAATNLNADIAFARAVQGRKIILSIGGAGNDMSFPDRATSQAFVASVASLYTQLGGFDGIDWDTYEGSDSPDTTEMIWISLQLKGMYPGFLITTPPAPWSTVDQTFCAQMVAAGALDYAAPQYYDGPNLATEAYIVPNVQTWVGLLGENKVVVGFGIADATNYMTVAQVISTWNAILPNDPSIRGAFDWQIDVDQSTGWPFAIQVGPLINP